MVNRETNFNRKKVNKLKTIRDKKRARINRKKNLLNVDKNEDVVLNKKQMKRQRNLERIYKELDQKNIIKKEKPKRRSKRGGKKHRKDANSQSEMQVEN